MRSVIVESLGIRGFRNLATVDIGLGPGFNVLSGDNGQGKTNVLEAVYVVATSKSFRTAKLSELVQAGGRTASVRARVREANDVREQTVGLQQGQRIARVDGKRASGLAEYAVRTPVVVFHPGAVALSAGPGSERRKLLDRIALYASPGGLAEATAYGRAMRARQRLLETRGETASGIDAWEDLLVRHGLGVAHSRASAVGQLGPAVERAFARIGSPGMEIQVRYDRSAPEDATEYRKVVAASRVRDRARRSASIGPHRDELMIALDGQPVRGMASQGQHRTVVLALELAEMEVIAEARGVHPVLLLDDVSSELDRKRTAALLSVLAEQKGQVLLTTTRPELLELGGLAADRRRDFAVFGGAIAPLAAGTTVVHAGEH